MRRVTRIIPLLLFLAPAVAQQKSDVSDGADMSKDDVYETLDSMGFKLYLLICD